MQQQETNVPGVIGFCLMILGYLTCGVLCVPALFLCGYAMYREPKGLATAGFILSVPGFLFAGIFGILFMAGVFIPVATSENKPKPKTVHEQLEKIQSERQR